MLSWDDFRYIKAIAESRSLNGAAQMLKVNHSTVFRRLGQVEEHLGSRLFDRSRSGYALTPSGEEMVRLAERIGNDVVSFERKISGQDLRPSGELRVTVNDLVLLHLLTEILVDFRRAYPEIVLDVVVSNTMLNLSRRDADVAVRATYVAPETLSAQRVSNVAWAVFGAARDNFRDFHLAMRPTTIGLDSSITWSDQGDEVAEGPHQRRSLGVQSQQHARHRRKQSWRRRTRAAAVFVGQSIRALPASPATARA
jgi:DNA-binding transcriptional LysR family regulator